MNNPLQTPSRDSVVLRTFLDAFHIKVSPDRDLGTLVETASAFARIPYENLTKIIRYAEAGNSAEARREPGRVVEDHLNLGTGGTCFSLTSTMLHLVRALGWQAEPILADRRYGPNTHSALLVWIDGKPHLLDPGYLVVNPIPLHAAGEVRLRTEFNEVVLQAREDGNKVDLSTVSRGQKTYRLTFKTQPVDAGEFLKVWDTSFDADMMNYPVLTHVRNGEQIYMQEQHYQVRTHAGVQRVDLTTDQLVTKIAEEFGIAPEVAQRALTILKRKGASHGSPTVS